MVVSTLDEAQEKYRANPTGETAWEYIQTATSYWLDDIIGDEEHESILKEVGVHSERP